MHKGMKRTLATALCACLTLGALTGCSKKESKKDTAAALLSIDKGASVSVGAADFYLRYQQAAFEVGIGGFLRSYYGDIWNSDLTGSGEAYGNTFKTQVLEDLEHMVLASEHAADYGIELSDDEKKAISDAADQLIADNSEEALEQLAATKEAVEEALTLYTIRTKVEKEMCADVDTEVSDEEAAQTTIEYVAFVAQTEAETEETESVTEGAEAVTEAVSEAVLEAETEVKTGAGETEVETAEAADESVAEEASSESETEVQEETESAEMIAARQQAMADAQAFLEKAKKAEDFSVLAAEAADASASVTNSSATFGEEDSFPDDAIKAAVKGLEDGALVDEVINVGTSYYVVYVSDAFDEDATESRKEEIVNERKNEAIEALYEEWNGATEFKFDQDTWTTMLFDRAFEAVEEETEELSEADAGEGVAEVGTEAEEAAETEKVTEKVTE